MKKLFILSFAIIIMANLSAQCYKVDTVINSSTVKYIVDRAVEFGTKTTLEEIIADKYSLCDSGSIIVGEIFSIYMPEELINIIGMQFLKRTYVITTKVTIDGKVYTGKYSKTIYLNAMFLEVSQIPHNKKVFYKTMQHSLKNAVN